METFSFETSENPIRLFSVQLAGYLYGNTRLAEPGYNNFFRAIWEKPPCDLLMGKMKISFDFHQFFNFFDFWLDFRVIQDAIELYKVITQVLSTRRSTSKVLAAQLATPPQPGDLLYPPDII